MGGMLRIFVVAAVIALAGVSILIVRTTITAGEWTTLQPMFDGACEPLDGFAGAEDLVLDPQTRIVYSAGVDRRALWREGRETRGAIWAIPLDAPQDARRVDLSGGAPEEFHPHGIDLHIGADGVRRLLVVNHTAAGDHINIFRLIEDGGFDLETTIADPLFRNVNDVAAIDAERFYVTLDKTSVTGSFGEIIEGALQRRTGRLAYFDGESASVVADGLIYANGVALSADGGEVYVAETVGRAVSFFDRDAATGALALRDRVFVGTGVDNITLDAEGRLFIAAHPKLLTFALGHAQDAEKSAPSQVIMLDAAAETVDQVFLSLGDDISGSATAVVDVDARRMLIGSVYEPHILSCTLPEVWRHSEAHPAARPQHEDAEGG